MGAASSINQDTLRSARLSFAAEITGGAISEAQLVERPEVMGVFRSRPVPKAGLRIAQRVMMKAGRLDFESGWVRRVLEARRAVLGAQAHGPPRFLIRVDEFPDAHALDDPRRGFAASQACHQTLAEHGVPYLIAVVAQHTGRTLDPAATDGRPLDAQDRGFIAQMAREGVTFAQHGTTHRTRYASPRKRSELSGLGPQETEALLGEGRDRLARAGVVARVFVPPFNRFDAGQYDNLARHFDVICGGPESVAQVGFHGSPLWRGDAVYLPCYEPFYAGSAHVSPTIDRMVTLAPGCWIPIVLHTGWELGDDFRGLAAFARKIAPYAASWDAFLAVVEASRTPISAEGGAGPDPPG
jgi:Uncharacterized protein conserved in bacteria (DUF2334)